MRFCWMSLKIRIVLVAHRGHVMGDDKREVQNLVETTSPPICQGARYTSSSGA